MSTSTWLNNVKLLAARPMLTGREEADVVIVGGGLAGTLTSYILGKAGKKVIVLEKKDIANSVTAYTTAWLSAVIDTDLSDLVKMYKREGAKKIWHSGLVAVDLIEKIAKEEGIECEFKRVPNVRYASTKNEMKHIESEHEVARDLGFNTTLHPPKHLPFLNMGSIELPDQAKYHPVKFLVGLRQACEKYGVVFYENSEALSLEEGNTDKRVVVKTKSGEVEAEYSVMATYQPFQNSLELFAHTGMYVSYVYEVEIPAGIIAEGLYEDEENPYHYFRIDEGEDEGKEKKYDRMILGGEDHRKEIPIPEAKNFRALKSYLDKLLPGVKYKIVRKWTGPILETIDGLPYIGQYSKKYPTQLVATGFSGNGMTYSAISAQILGDIILKRKNQYTSLYSPLRKTKIYNLMIKGRDFGGELLGGAAKNIFK